MAKAKLICMLETQLLRLFFLMQGLIFVIPRYALVCLVIAWWVHFACSGEVGLYLRHFLKLTACTGYMVIPGVIRAGKEHESPLRTALLKSSRELTSEPQSKSRQSDESTSFFIGGWYFAAKQAGISLINAVK